MKGQKATAVEVRVRKPKKDQADRNTFAGRRSPAGGPAKARFMAIRNTFFGVVGPKLPSPSQHEARNADCVARLF